jgi:NADP-dependent 3-hydroxy acid dehydrogenase YdfG
MVPIQDRVFLVTGGGGAIAASVLAELSRAGAKLAVVDRSADTAARGVAVAGGLAIAADLTTPAGAQAMVAAASAHYGRVDGLIHTVGGFTMGPLDGGDPVDYERMFDVNVRTLYYALRAVVPVLRAQGDGFVCGFSSEPGWTGRAPGSALYGASKSAVATLLHSLDGELRGTQVRVAIVYPMGAVDTPANRHAMPGVDPATLIDPSAIGEAIVFAATRPPRGRTIDYPIYPAR